MADILDVIESFGSRLDWYVVEFEPTMLADRLERTKHSPPSWITELWQKSEAGVVQALSWERLKELSAHITQTMNALLVATDPGTPAPSSALDPNDERYRLVIQAIDTSFGQ